MKYAEKGTGASGITNHEPGTKPANTGSPQPTRTNPEAPENFHVLPIKDGRHTD
jgi:hypothetical protein